MNDAQSFGIILEEIRDQNKAVLEAVGDLQAKVSGLPAMQQDISDLKSDMKVVKAAIVDVSNEQKSFDQRLAKLEAA